MSYRRLKYLIFGVFFACIVFLGVIQYCSSSNMDKLINGNKKLIKELQINSQLREIERNLYLVESKIRGMIISNDTIFLRGIDQRIAETEQSIDILRRNASDKSFIPNLNRLYYLTEFKLKNKNRVLSDYLKTGSARMDTDIVTNPSARILSKEVRENITFIHDKRQAQIISLINEVAADAESSRLNVYILILIIVLSAGGMSWCVIIIIRNQNQLITQLDSSEKSARKAAAVKENFLTNVSHEIRTPLNAIIGFTSLLKQQPLNQKAREYNDNIEKAGESLIAIVNDILDASKIEAGMMRISPQPFNISELIDSVRNLFLERARRKNITLNYRMTPDIPDALVGDPTRLTQVLVNLIGNALKFTEAGSVTVQVYVRSKQAKNVEIGFRVTDTGIGIDKDKVSFIFDRFNQADDSITRQYGGTGLGLSIVKDLILLQGGNIEVESEPGKGTTFNFYIPYTVALDQIQHEMALNTHAAQLSGYKFISLLVVDDNVMNQSLMTHLLSRWGVSFDVVSSGREAIEFLRQKKYSVVLMDIQMPEMDGYSTTAQIRDTLKSNVPIIAMTAHAMPGEREKCIVASMNDYISKPVNEKELIKLISKFVPLEQKDGVDGQAPVQERSYQYIDLSYMKEISLGNIEYERKVTSQFIEHMTQNMEELYAAYTQKDLDKLHRIAHEMKTSISVMGLVGRLNKPLDFIEHAKVINNELYSCILEVNEVCLAALEEAVDFYTKLKLG